MPSIDLHLDKTKANSVKIYRHVKLRIYVKKLTLKFAILHTEAPRLFDEYST